MGKILSRAAVLGVAVVSASCLGGALPALEARLGELRALGAPLTAQRPREALPPARPAAAPAPDERAEAASSAAPLASAVASVDPAQSEDPEAVAEGAERSLMKGATEDVDDGAAELDLMTLARLAHERLIAAQNQPRLVSIAHETWVFASPKRQSNGRAARRIGYLRAGAVVARSEEPVGYAGCKGGWYKIEPQGYVCLGRSASLDPAHPIVAATPRRADRDGLPYDYVMSRLPAPPFYVRLPTSRELAIEEPDLAGHLKQMKRVEADPSFVPLPAPEPMPAELAGGGSLPLLADAKPRAAGQLTVGRAGLRSGFALLSQFEHEGRRWGVTTDLFAIPLDRTRWIKESSFHGVELGGELSLPVAFVMKKHATRWVDADGDPTTSAKKAGDALGFREAVALTGRSEGGFLEAKDGSFVKAEDARVIDGLTRAPVWAKPGRRWVDVSILKQALVAYDGTTPVYVTLVSTGRDGLGDPKKTHSTVQGAFLIHTKHVSVTMDGDETGDEFDLRDVPFVQYFTDGYALHAAYWHDDFGTPRSHGCVNLAPKDAAWLFGWTTPEVPAAWHGALSLKGGTIVFTHP